MLALSVLFLMLSAQFVFAVQVIVYAGAVMVLFLFVVALLPAGGAEGAPDLGRMATAAIGGGAILLALAVAVATVTPRAAAGPVGGVADLGRSLFDPARLLVPFELTAPLLLVAIVGAVTIWRRQEGGRPGL